MACLRAVKEVSHGPAPMNIFDGKLIPLFPQGMAGVNEGSR